MIIQFRNFKDIFNRDICFNEGLSLGALPVARRSAFEGSTVAGLDPSVGDLDIANTLRGKQKHLRISQNRRFSSLFPHVHSTFPYVLHLFPSFFLYFISSSSLLTFSRSPERKARWLE